MYKLRVETNSATNFVVDNDVRNVKVVIKNVFGKYAPDVELHMTFDADKVIMESVKHGEVISSFETDPEIVFDGTAYFLSK